MNKKLSRDEELAQCNLDYHDHNLTELHVLHKVMFAAIDAMEESGIPYALIGGVAVKSMGRTRVTHDVDLFVRPDDADKVLQVLEKKNFQTQKRDPYWLYKAWQDEILVDVIFKSTGDIYFDEEVRAHVRRVPYLGRFINSISPEDLIIIKAAAHQENNPHHWHDALAVLKQGNLDWDYLLKRAKNAPRRILSLLVYAQSNDIAVPNEVIQKLYRTLFEAPAHTSDSVIHPYRADYFKLGEINDAPKDSPVYIKGRIMEALTTDERISDHDIKVIVTETSVFAKGEVFTEEQKDAVDEVIARIASNCEIMNQVNVRVLSGPEGSEAIK
ncbi:MAG TPA: nucleotidyltransferase [Bacteriovoracaceae bacterium]|nr:nucleotidyltransferase [Bacteriovoracaceae bacterium]